MADRYVKNYVPDGVYAYSMPPNFKPNRKFVLIPLPLRLLVPVGVAAIGLGSSVPSLRFIAVVVIAIMFAQLAPGRILAKLDLLYGRDVGYLLIGLAIVGASNFVSSLA